MMDNVLYALHASKEKSGRRQVEPGENDIIHASFASEIIRYAKSGVRLSN
jgi:hypothetical protein